MEDQSLLVLRIDKGLSWNELAVVFSAAGAAMEEAEVLRSAARLRQRFASIKRRLRAMAEDEGLL
jgi:RNA polymerase sigma-70 factor (ECF subfamily)